MLSIAPSEMTDNPYKFGLIRGLKKADPAVLKLSRRCMETVKEMLELTDKLEMSKVMKLAFNVGEETRAVLTGENRETAN